MITKTKDKSVFQGDVARWMETMGENLKNSMAKAVRKTFDEAMTDSKATACILIAKQLGLIDLAVEMEVDLNNELNEPLELAAYEELIEEHATH